MTKPIPAETRAKFAKPIAARFVKRKPGKSNADYVPHPVIRQYLLALTDAHRETVVREVATAEVGIRKSGKDAGKEYPYTKVAMLVRLEVCIDGEWYGPWEEWGESENEANPYKSAQSDAIKRLCAMHLGLGLSLWARGDYLLDDAINREIHEAIDAAPEATRPAVDDGLAEEDEPDAPPVPDFTPPPATETERVEQPYEKPAPLNKSFYAAWNATMKGMDCDKATERAALHAIYGDEALGTDERGIMHSIKFLDPDKARKLLHALKEGAGKDSAEEKQLAFLNAGVALLAQASEGE